jgi:hypothetical protein
MHWILYVTQTRTMMTFVLILWMKKIIGERSFPSLGERMLTIKLLGIYTVLWKFLFPYILLLVSFIWNKKTTLIKINNNEKGFIQVKETIQASHQQWNIKKITIFFRSGKSWFGLVNHLGSPERMSCKKICNFVFTVHRITSLFQYYDLIYICKKGYGCKWTRDNIQFYT